MIQRIVLSAVVLTNVVGVCSVSAQPVLPNFSSAVFDNPYFPLVPGNVMRYHAVATDPDTGETETEAILVEVLHQTRTVAGIETGIVRDRVHLDDFEGLVIEDTFDWYAQDNDGNVWYMGEEVTDFEYDDEGNLIGTSHPGAWETGVDGALPGYIMEANPQIGDHYYQELYVGEAEDDGEVIGLDETLTIPLGTFENLLQTRELSLDPDVFAHKYYARGLGAIAEREFLVDGGTLIQSVNFAPEPAGGLLMALGAIGLFTRRRVVRH